MAKDLGKRKIRNSIIKEGTSVKGGRTKRSTKREDVPEVRHATCTSSHPRFYSLKGQYRIVSEILLFAIGLAIASFVVVVFTDLQESIAQTSAKDQMLSVSNLISASIIKSIEQNTTISLRVPDTVSNEVYIISIQSNNGGPCTVGKGCLIILSTADSGITVTQQLFNITQSHSIIGNVYSTARYINITSSGTTITVDRA